MAGRAEAAHGSDRASNIMKYDGLPGTGKPIIEEFKKPAELPIVGSFVSTMGPAGIELNPIASTAAFGDAVQKPKFTAKITLFDSHGDDNF